MFYVGTSGYAFKEWKGPFYPAKLPDKEMLSFYATRFPAVEINNTFYRLPQEKVVVEWGEQVPPTFRFAIKASQRITHHHQLRDVADLMTYMTDTVRALGEKLGPTLFQLPPHLKKDLPRLEAFLTLVPKRWQAAFEFRNPSWFSDDVFEALKEANASLCISDQDDLETPVVATAGWGYVRLHRAGYDDTSLAQWAGRLKSLPWTEGYVFFKHDHAPDSGPPVAEALITKLSG